MTTQHDQAHPLVPYSLYFKVWLALIVLTVLTVSVSCVDMQQTKILTALVIATLKMMLVVLYFMHVRYERPIYAYMIGVVILTYGVFITLTFSDYFYR